MLSSGSVKQADARRLMKEREGDVAKPSFLTGCLDKGQNTEGDAGLKACTTSARS